jgi:hypothetical protein
MQRADTPSLPAVLDLSGDVMGTRENKRTKAARLLVTGRLRILRVDSDYIAAECKGDSGEVYSLGFKDGLWTCSCLARTDCSHMNALWAVTAVRR